MELDLGVAVDELRLDLESFDPTAAQSDSPLPVSSSSSVMSKLPTDKAL